MKKKTQDTYPILDANGQVFNAPVYQDNNGNAYTVDGNGNTYYIERQNTFDQPVQLDDVNVYAPSPQQMLDKALADYSTMSNNSLSVYNTRHRPYNPHLENNAQRGAISHNTWTNEHPNLDSWGYIPSTTVLATASAPFALGIGDVVSGTALGQGITNTLGIVANSANNSTWLPWINTALTSYFGSQGLRDIQDGNFTPETAINLAPLIQMGKPIYETGKSVYSVAKNWRPSVPWDNNRYYRIVGKTGDPIGDAIESGVIRGPGAIRKGIEAAYLEDKPNTITLLPKAHDYPMFAKGKPWRGGAARRDSGKPIIIRSKKDTGPIVWQESNKDFRHKGHNGIFRPTYYGELNSTPTKYFEYWEPMRLGYMRKDFPVDTNPYHNFMGRGYKVDRGSWTDSDLGIEGENFGKYVGSGGEQTVFEDLTNTNNVLKVYNDTYAKSVEDLRPLVNSYLQRNTVPMQQPVSFTGYVKDNSSFYPVFSQGKLQPLRISNAEYTKQYLPLVQEALNKAGYSGDGINTEFSNGTKTLVDLKADNMGLTPEGKLKFFDVDFITNGH